MLKKAWNSFARKLNIDFSSIFVCRQCGPNPEIVVCDGTMAGFRKGFLPALDNEKDTTNDFLVEGSHHQDRVYVRIPKIRKLLLFFCGINEIKLSGGGEKQPSKKFMSYLEYKELHDFIARKRFYSVGIVDREIKK